MYIHINVAVAWQRYISAWARINEVAHLSASCNLAGNQACTRCRAFLAVGPKVGGIKHAHDHSMSPYQKNMAVLKNWRTWKVALQVARSRRLAHTYIYIYIYTQSGHASRRLFSFRESNQKERVPVCRGHWAFWVGSQLPCRSCHC